MCLADDDREERATTAETQLTDLTSKFRLVSKAKRQAETRLVALLREKNTLQRKLQGLRTKPQPTPTKAGQGTGGGAAGASQGANAGAGSGAGGRDPREGSAKGTARKLQPAPLSTAAVGPEERVMLCRRIRRLQLHLDDRDDSVKSLEAEVKRLQAANQQLTVRFRAASAARKRVARKSVSPSPRSEQSRKADARQ